MIQGYTSLYNDYEKLLIENNKLSKENHDLKYLKNLYEQHNNDYENILIKNDKLSKENRTLKYLKNLLENQNEVLRKNAQQSKEEILEKELLD